LQFRVLYYLIIRTVYLTKLVCKYVMKGQISMDIVCDKREFHRLC
jgi:hypothetical protein